MIVFAHRRCIAFDKDLKAQRPNDDRRLTIKSRTGWKLYTKKHLSSGHSLFVRRQASKQIKKKLRITSLLLTFISFSMLLMPLVVEIFYENCDLRFREHMLSRCGVSAIFSHLHQVVPCRKMLYFHDSCKWNQSLWLWKTCQLYIKYLMRCWWCHSAIIACFCPFIPLLSTRHFLLIYLRRRHRSVAAFE